MSLFRMTSARGMDTVNVATLTAGWTRGGFHQVTGSSEGFLDLGMLSCGALLSSGPLSIGRVFAYIIDTVSPNLSLFLL